MPPFKSEKLNEHLVKAKEQIRRKAIRGTATGYECRYCGRQWGIGEEEAHHEKCIAVVDEDLSE